MKKISFILFSLLLTIGCNNNSTTTRATDQQQDKDTFNVHLFAVDTTAFDKVYDEELHSYEVTYKSKKCDPGHQITASYHANTDGTASYFMVMVDIICKDIKASKMIVKTETSSYEFYPTLVQPCGNGISLVVFSFLDTNMASAMKEIALSGTYVNAYVLYNGNELRIPLKEVQQIRNIARSYINDGGKFE